MRSLQHLIRTAVTAAVIGAAVLPVVSAGAPSGGRAAPAPPVFTQTPDNPSASTEARFAWRHDSSSVTFSCSLDRGAWHPCPTPYVATVSNANPGMHRFEVRAVDRAGSRSSSAMTMWQIAIFDIGVDGSVPDPLAPGVWRPVEVRVVNPYNFAIQLTALQVQVTSSPGTCPAQTHVEISQAPIDAASPVEVAADTTMDLAGGQRPQIRLLDLDRNQDACKGARFTLGFEAMATR